jgi:hypothetical protein
MGSLTTGAENALLFVRKLGMLKAQMTASGTQSGHSTDPALGMGGVSVPC